MRRGGLLRYDARTRPAALLVDSHAVLPELPTAILSAPALTTPPSPSIPPPVSVFTKVSSSERARQMYTATLGATSAAIAAAELASKLTVDVHAFINAEADAPVPASLRQAARLINTPELEECAARVTSGVARGVTNAASAAMSAAGTSSSAPEPESSAGAAPPTSVVERALGKVLDPANWGLVSVLVAGTTRQTLEAVIEVFKEQYGADGSASSPVVGRGVFGDALEATLDALSDDRGRAALLDVCSCFVSVAVGTYLDKTAGSNTFDDFFAAALAASNREAFGDIAGRVTGEAVRTVAEVVSPNASRALAAARARGRSQTTDPTDPNAAESPHTPPGAGLGAGPPSSAFRGHGADSPRDVFGAANGSSDASPDSAERRHRRAESFADSDERSDAPERSAAMAAAFTAALVDDVAPRVFRLMCAPEGRALIAEVAGTCCASATRSLVLAARDVVFFVDTRPAARRVDEGEEEDGHRGGVSFGGMFRVARVPRLTAANAVRVAIAAVLVLWLVQALHAACAAVVGIVGFGSEDAIEAAQAAAAKAGGGETAASASKALGWWGS